MSTVKKTLYISKMTCINCQNKIEKKLRNTAGITKASVSYSKGTAQITYDPELISLRDISRIIEKLGYEAQTEKKESPKEVARIAGCFVIIVILYIALQETGLLNLLVPGRLADTNMGYGMLFLVGLITSVHCIAMCGGINLTQCLPGSAASEVGDGKWSTFRPAVLYNLGRVISYTVIGFLLGFVGMLLSGGSGTGLPVLLQGILKLIAGIFMVIMGINMLDLLPWLRKLQPRMPKALAVRIGKQKAKSRQPLVVGLLNGLMPCGPLQSMQIVALASGNPAAGALSMFLFSLGTVPLMLGLGSVVSALGKRFAGKVMSVGAVLVVVLGLAMISQGGSLSGWLLPDRLLLLVIALSILGVVASLPFERTVQKAAAIVAAAVVLIVCQGAWSEVTEANSQQEASASAEGMELEDGVQVINSTLSPGRYPNITVQVGIPVKWVINAPEGSINGCNYRMLVDEYGIEYSFQNGENVIEFTPTEVGSYVYTCWMGMIRGTIVVTDGSDGITLQVEEPVYENYGTFGSCCE